MVILQENEALRWAPLGLWFGADFYPDIPFGKGGTNFEMSVSISSINDFPASIDTALDAVSIIKPFEPDTFAVNSFTRSDADIASTRFWPFSGFAIAIIV